MDDGILSDRPRDWGGVGPISKGHRYLVFNKPYDVLSQFTDTAGRMTLGAFVPVSQVYPVGRLDRDSEGLLLLTSDGRFQHQLSHPKFDHPKTYWVQVERVPDESALARLRDGLVIQDYRTRRAAVRPISPPAVLPRNPPIRYRKTVPTAWLELTLTEGRNRQIRRMTAAVGFPTLRLIRVAIATLNLGTLAPGEWRDLSLQEVSQLKRSSRQQNQGQSRGRQNQGRRGQKRRNRRD